MPNVHAYKMITKATESPLLDWIFDLSGVQVLVLQIDVFGEGTVFHAWDLHLFGVLPEFQGKGVAGALMSFADGLVSVVSFL